MVLAGFDDICKSGWLDCWVDRWVGQGVGSVGFLEENDERYWKGDDRVRVTS